MSDALGGESGSAKRARRAARADIEKQKQKEELRLAESESEIATDIAVAKKGGRRSLIKSSPTGHAVNLGGTQ